MKEVRVYFGPPHKPMSNAEKGCWLGGCLVFVFLAALGGIIAAFNGATGFPDRPHQADFKDTPLKPKKVHESKPVVRPAPVKTPLEDETPKLPIKAKGTGGFPPP
jgi:hypothetical protein